VGDNVGGNVRAELGFTGMGNAGSGVDFATGFVPWAGALRTASSHSNSCCKASRFVVQSDGRIEETACLGVDRVPSTTGSAWLGCCVRRSRSLSEAGLNALAMPARRIRSFVLLFVRIFCSRCSGELGNCHDG
jgi:hypothetical protein